MTKQEETIVFVHGAWAGAWCWDGVRALLTERGVRSVAVELPGHGTRADEHPEDLKTLADAVTEAIEGCDGTVTLVAHSFGGVVASQAAEAVHTRVSKIVYVAAFVLDSGTSFMDAAGSAKGSRAIEHLVFSDDERTVWIDPNEAHAAIAHDASAEQFAAIAPLFVPEPTGPLKSPLQTTVERWGSIPRHYVQTLTDRALPPVSQIAMCERFPPVAVHHIDSAHLPMLTAVDDLAELLSTIATSPRPPLGRWTR